VAVVSATSLDFFKHAATDIATAARGLRPFHRAQSPDLALNWHLEVIAAKLTAVRERKIRRRLINKPYVVDNIQCIFHPSMRERAIAVCPRIRVE
jgi:hypothetical protein